MRFEVVKIDSIPSTNTKLKEMALGGAKIGTVLVAKSQSGGRGRLGRGFSSKDGGLYASILLPFDDTEAGVLTTCAAVLTARAIERTAPISVGIKWVNDLYVGGKKLCGILAESVAREDGRCAVLGIGVNLTNKLPSELSGIATTLFDECGREISPDALLDALLCEFSGFENINYNEILDEYRHRCIILGKNIDVVPHNGEKYAAKAIDLLPDGSLLVEKEENGERIIIFSGEVSTRIPLGGAL